MTTTMALIAASDFNDEHFKGALAANIFDRIIAVDAGFSHLQSLDCAPDIAIGDFDSLGYEPQDVEHISFPAHKDKSDLELALDYAVVEGADALYVYGAFGGRLDHTFANIQLLARFAEMGLEVTAVDSAAVAYYVVGPDTLDLPPCNDGIVSVFSLVPESLGVTEVGLEYPLSDAVLSDRTTLGLSNKFAGRHASITVDEGTLLVLRPFVS